MGKSFGIYLRQLMEKRHVKSIELAEQLNVDHSLVKKWLSGARVPSLKAEYYDLLCKVLHLERNECRSLKFAQVYSLDDSILRLVEVQQLEESAINAQLCEHYLNSQWADTKFSRYQVQQDSGSSEEIYRLLFVNSVDPILITRPNGTILSANPAACDFFQMSEGEICNVGREGLVDPEDENITMFLAERQSVGKARSFITHVKKDGTRQRTETTAACFSNNKGDLTAYIILRAIDFGRQPLERLHELSL